MIGPTNAQAVATSEDLDEFAVRNIKVSQYPPTPSDGNNGDIWICPKTAFTYRVNFDSSLFPSSQSTSLTYAKDAVNFTPVTNSLTALGSASPGSWVSGNPLIDSMFYATFDTDGSILHYLDPNDLTKDIDGNDVSTEITQKNVMLVIPTLYTQGDSTGFTISTDPTEGTAYAHTYDGHTYKYLAIGVYEGTIVSGKLMSVSGTTEPSNSVSRPNFRTAAQANGEGWMLTNFYVNRLMRMLYYLFLRNFDGQRNLGQGFSSGGSDSAGNRALVPGLANGLGRFAGNPSGTSNVVKCLIENPWASKWEFLDDIVKVDANIYLGQRLKPDDTTSNMTLAGSLSSAACANGWATAIQTGDVLWGVWDNNSGGDSQGLCDYHWYNTGSMLCLAGGSSHSGSNCGPGCLNVDGALSYSSWSIGARPAFVFD